MQVVLKIAKTRFFFQAPFSTGKRLEKKRVFRSFKDHLHLFDHQTILKNIARILYDFCIFGILKKTHKFDKIGKTSGNTLDGIFWYGEIMSRQLSWSMRRLAMEVGAFESPDLETPSRYFWSQRIHSKKMRKSQRTKSKIRRSPPSCKTQIMFKYWRGVTNMVIESCILVAKVVSRLFIL